MTWFFVTVVLPVVLPIFAMVVLRSVPAVNVGAHWIAPIKDGQLSWLALGMAFSGIYELVSEPRPKVMAGEHLVWGVLSFSLLILASGLLAAVSSVGTPTSAKIPSGKPWYKHFVTLLGSLVLTVVTAGGYTWVHFSQR